MVAFLDKRFDENQPRNAHGEWSSVGGASTGVAGFADRQEFVEPVVAPTHAAADASPENVGERRLAGRKLYPIEKKLANEKNFEHAYVIDEDGTATEIGYENTHNGINFRDSEVNRMFGKVATHNHPGSPNSFSVNDLVLAAYADTDEIRVISKGPAGKIYLHRAYPGKDGLWPDRFELERLWWVEESLGKLRSSRSVLNGEVTRGEAIRDHVHKINERVAAQLGYVYERIEIDKPKSKVVFLEKRFDESQPRNAHGEWSSTGGGSAGVDGDAASHAEKPSEANAWSSGRKFDSIEDMIYEMPNESAFFFRKNGATRIGSSETDVSVTFSDADAKFLRGKTLTHNHPGGLAFSSSDIIFAAKNELAEIRAVGLMGDKKYLYRALPKKGGEWPGVMQLAEMLGQQQRVVRIQLSTRIMSGQMSTRQAHEQHSHLVMQKVAKQAGFVYERIEVKT